MGKYKYLILDKNILEGISTTDLRRFAEQHFLILPCVLQDECVTNEAKAARLLDRYGQIILAGAFLCPCIRSIAEAEAQSLQPYGRLPDLEGTKSWRKALRDGLGPRVPADAESTRKGQLGVAESFLANNQMVIETLFGEQFRQAESEIRHAQARRGDRLKRWVQIVDRQPLAGWSTGILEYFRGTPIDDCLVSDKWMTWHHLRVSLVMRLKHRFLGESRPADEVEHDLQDNEYVSLLSRADGIITEDKGLIELAEAAFPEKDVFSSLEEVPESYRCDWTGS